MATRNRTKLAVLGFLTWKPMTGYEIRKEIEGSISNFWSESYGQIYPILQQLADEGLATRTTSETEGGRPQHVYAITPAGRAALAEWLAEPVAPSPIRNELLLKLFFGSQTDAAVSIAHVEALERRLRAMIARYEEIANSIARDQACVTDARYWLMTLRMGLAVNRAMLGWAAETLGELEAIKASAPSSAALRKEPEERAKASPKPTKSTKSTVSRKPRAKPRRA